MHTEAPPSLVLNHPEFGQTLSRADGIFDLAVNGGGLLTVDYQKAGYLKVQRQVSGALAGLCPALRRGHDPAGCSGEPHANRAGDPDRWTQLHFTTIAGNGSSQSSGDGGPATAAGLGSPFSIDVAADGSLCITEFSERVRRVGPDGVLTIAAGNGRDRFESYVAPDAGSGASVTRCAYNADHSLARVTRPDGTPVDYSYDGAGRLSSVALGRGQIRYSYDPATGMLAVVTAPDGGTLTIRYNGSIPTVSTWSGTVAGAIRRTSDSDLRLTSRTVNGAQPITFQDDRDGLLRQAGDLMIRRDAANGFIAGTTFGNTADTCLRRLRRADGLPRHLRRHRSVCHAIHARQARADHRPRPSAASPPRRPTLTTRAAGSPQLPSTVRAPAITPTTAMETG